MNIEDIKIGETYNVRVKVVKNDFGDTGEIATVTVDENGQAIDGEIAYYTEADAASFSSITPENGTKNSEPAPKYDPCRLFKKGDKVRIKTVNGRDSHGLAEKMKGKILTVLQNEKTCWYIFVSDPIGDDFIVDPAYLELVTPAEEQERYVVEPGDLAYFIVDKKHESGEQNVVMYMFAFHPHAKAAAEAECARLNAEYRKEQNNGWNDA